MPLRSSAGDAQAAYLKDYHARRRAAGAPLTLVAPTGSADAAATVSTPVVDAVRAELDMLPGPRLSARQGWRN
jgi:hypothetical protein